MHGAIPSDTFEIVGTRSTRHCVQLPALRSACLVARFPPSRQHLLTRIRSFCLWPLLFHFFPFFLVCLSFVLSFFSFLLPPSCCSLAVSGWPRAPRDGVCDARVLAVTHRWCWIMTEAQQQQRHGRALAFATARMTAGLGALYARLGTQEGPSQASLFPT